LKARLKPYLLTGIWTDPASTSDPATAKLCPPSGVKPKATA